MSEDRVERILGRPADHVIEDFPKTIPGTEVEIKCSQKIWNGEEAFIIVWFSSAGRVVTTHHHEFVHRKTFSERLDDFFQYLFPAPKIRE